MTESQGAILTFAMPLIVVGIWRIVFILSGIARTLAASQQHSAQGE